MTILLPPQTATIAPLIVEPHYTTATDAKIPTGTVIQTPIQAGLYQTELTPSFQTHRNGLTETETDTGTIQQEQIRIHVRLYSGHQSTVAA